MSKVFVDAAASIALLNRSDALRPSAQQTLTTSQKQNAQLITTEFVLLEGANALSSPSIRRKTVAFVGELRNMVVLQIIPASQMLLMEGWSLYQQRSEKEWGLTDCMSIAVMRLAQIIQAFTSDRHFTQAGFTRLL